MSKTHGISADKILGMTWAPARHCIPYMRHYNPGLVYLLGCANKDLWALCAPIFIIVVYCKTATSYFLGGKE